MSRLGFGEKTEKPGAKIIKEQIQDENTCYVALDVLNRCRSNAIVQLLPSSSFIRIGGISDQIAADFIHLSKPLTTVIDMYKHLQLAGTIVLIHRRNGDNFVLIHKFLKAVQKIDRVFVKVDMTKLLHRKNTDGIGDMMLETRHRKCSSFNHNVSLHPAGENKIIFRVSNASMLSAYKRLRDHGPQSQNMKYNPVVGDKIISIQNRRTNSRGLRKLMQPNNKMTTPVLNSPSSVVVFPLMKTSDGKPVKRQQEEKEQKLTKHRQGQGQQRSNTDSEHKEGNIKYKDGNKDMFAIKETDDKRQADSVHCFQPQVKPSRENHQTASTSGPLNRTQRAQYPNYQDASCRRLSFKSWRNEAQNIEMMTKYGFFYTGEGDLVKCFCCGIGLEHWNTHDDPLFEHIKYSPDCSYLLKLKGSKSLNNYKKRQLQAVAQGGNVSDAVTVPGADSVGKDSNSQFLNLDDRLASFTNWPDNTNQTPNDLAAAGFYYTGTDDTVCCYDCGGMLGHWEPTDEPFQEHARWFPHCKHIIMVCGSAFVDGFQRAVSRVGADASAEGETHPVSNSSSAECEPVSGQRLWSSQDHYRRLERTDPIYKPSAQSVIQNGYSRSAVKMALDKLEEQGVEDTAKNILLFLMEKEDSGESLPQDIPTSVDDDERQILKENLLLKEAMFCIQCGLTPKEILFLPCTHHSLCERCSIGTVLCVECRQLITAKIKTIMVERGSVN